MFVLAIFTCIVSLLWSVQFLSDDPGAPINQFINICFIITWVLLCTMYVYTRVRECKREIPLREKLLS